MSRHDVSWKEAFKSALTAPWTSTKRLKFVPIPPLEFFAYQYYGWKGYFWYHGHTSTNLVKVGLDGKEETVWSCPSGNWSSLFSEGEILHSVGGLVKLDDILRDYTRNFRKVINPEGVVLGAHTFWVSKGKIFYHHYSRAGRIHIPTEGMSVRAVTTSGLLPYFLTTNQDGEWFIASPGG